MGNTGLFSGAIRATFPEDVELEYLDPCVFVLPAIQGRLMIKILV
jgi:hypothetical protein